MSSQKLFIKNKKGLRLSAIIDKPNGKEPFSFVLLLHGFKGYKEETTYSDLAKRLLDINVGSIRFDASGFGESEGDFETEYRLTNYVNDAEKVYKWLLGQPFVDKNHLGVMGQSMGGALAIIFSSKHPEIKAVVSVSPPDIFATRDEFGKNLDDWKKRGYIEVDSSRAGKIKVPFDYALDASKYDIKKYAAEVKSPKLFIVGLNDITVVPDQSRDVYKKALEPKEIVEVEGMGHFYKEDPSMLKSVNIKIVKFLKQNL